MRFGMRGWPVKCLICMIGLSVVWQGCCMVTNKLVTRTDNTSPRSAETGLLDNAAPRELGPTDSERAVLLVHGFLGSGQNFADLPERLAAEGWRVRVMLLPGHGTSPRDLEKTTRDELVEAVSHEAQALRTHHAKLVLVGHSMGGALSVLTAAAEPVDGLVLIAPYFGVTYHWYYLLPPETWLRAGSPFIRWLYKGRMFVQVNRPEDRDAIFSYAWTPTRAVTTLAALGVEARQPECLHRVACPVLMIHSTDDTAASFDRASAAYDLFPSPRKQFVKLTRSNHHILFDYDKEEAIETILAFLRAL